MNIGLIAGSGQFPILFSKAAREKGYRVMTVAFKNEADPALEGIVSDLEWQHLGQVKRLIRYFKKNDVHDVVMLGAIKKTRMFVDVRPDTKAISILSGMKSTHDDGLLRAFARVLEKENIAVRASTFLCPEMLAEEGVWSKRKPDQAEKKDIETGWKLAKEIGRLDIGQCIVISGGTVLAVEAIDGTDATIRRGGKLGKGNAVVVKVSKPLQDMRFDVPAVGAETIKTMHESGVSVLVIEAGKAVVFDRKEMIGLADQHKIVILALKDGKF
ncbi:MAG: UDP-2,3-diacylglucosamine diphosphatase LpxI [Proteobacteria bacterium]|nr:UDP-2,3-diacylglucosamine diphosphatase LpxI [Pseudomonadota bacterium]